MDIGTLRGLVTLALLLAFLGLVVRLYLPGRKTEFEAVARLPLEENPQPDQRSEETQDDY